MIGLKTWDRSGRLTSDMTRPISKVVGSFETGTTAGSRTVDFKLDGVRFFIQVHAGNAELTAKLPAVVLEGSTFTWEYGFTQGRGNYAANSIIYYGVY